MTTRWTQLQWHFKRLRLLSAALTAGTGWYGLLCIYNKFEALTVLPYEATWVKPGLTLLLAVVAVWLLWQVTSTVYAVTRGPTWWTLATVAVTMVVGVTSVGASVLSGMLGTPSLVAAHWGSLWLVWTDLIVVTRADVTAAALEAWTSALAAHPHLVNHVETPARVVQFTAEITAWLTDTVVSTTTRTELLSHARWKALSAVAAWAGTTPPPQPWYGWWGWWFGLSQLLGLGVTFFAHWLSIPPTIDIEHFDYGVSPKVLETIKKLREELDDTSDKTRRVENQMDKLGASVVDIQVDTDKNNEIKTRLDKLEKETETANRVAENALTTATNNVIAKKVTGNQEMTELQTFLVNRESQRRVTKLELEIIKKDIAINQAIQKEYNTRVTNQVNNLSDHVYTTGTNVRRVNTCLRNDLTDTNIRLDGMVKELQKVNPNFNPVPESSTTPNVQFFDKLKHIAPPNFVPPTETSSRPQQSASAAKVTTHKVLNSSLNNPGRRNKS